MKTFKHIPIVIIILLSFNFCFTQVGIGTINPTKTLDVNGELRVRTIPDNDEQGNRVLSVKPNGNVQFLKPPEILIEENIPNAPLRFPEVASALAYNDLEVSFTLVKPALVSITFNTKFTDIRSRVASDKITVAHGKQYGTILFVKNSESSIYTREFSDLRHFSSITEYVQDNYYSNGAKWMQLEPGTYDIRLRMRITCSLNDTEGMRVSIQDDPDTFLNVVALYN